MHVCMYEADLTKKKQYLPEPKRYFSLTADHQKMCVCYLKCKHFILA